MTRNPIRPRMLAAVITGAIFVPFGSGDGGAAEKGAKIGNTPFGNYLAGRHAQSQKDLSSAADFLGAALKTAPDAPDLLRRTFLISLAEGRIKDATALAQRVIAADPGAQVAQITLAVVDIRKRNFGAAIERLQKIENDGLGSFIAPALKAWCLIGAKKPEDGLKVLTEGKQEKATEALHAMHAALILDQLGRPLEAEQKFLSVVDDQSGPSLRIAQFLGELYERTGKRDKAAALYRKYIEGQPGTHLLDAPLDRLKTGKLPAERVATAADGAAEALFGIASSLRQQNAREMALVLGRLALYLKPEFPVLQVLLAEVLEVDGRLEPALALYHSVPRDSAFSWAARLRVASILDDLKRTDDAVKHLRRMARDRKDDPGPMIELGNLLRGHERFAEAVAAYDQALKRVPMIQSRHWTLLYARGIALERSKQWDRAEADFKKALEYQPDQPYVLNYLGYSWIDQGKNLAEAQEMIKKAAGLRPKDGYIVDSLGWGHYRLGRYEEAVIELERAVELRPQDPIINDHLGDAYWRVGRQREAIFQWNRALSHEPDEDLRTKIERKLKHGLDAATETAKTPRKDG